MGFLFDIIVGRIIARFIGLNVRYYFFKFIGKPIPKKKLSNEYKEGNDKDYERALGQDIVNALVGMAALTIALILISYLYYFLGF